jgi:hypothetical protein
MSIKEQNHDEIFIEKLQEIATGYKKMTCDTKK